MNYYYYLLNALRTELESMPLINSVTQGSLDDIDNYKQTVFPLMHIIINNMSITSKVITFNTSFIAMDIVDISKEETIDKFLGNDNEIDVLNTQHTILCRIYESLNRGTLYDQNIQAIDAAQIEPFTERFENYLAGMTMTVNILIPNNTSIC